MNPDMYTLPALHADDIYDFIAYNYELTDLTMIVQH